MRKILIVLLAGCVVLVVGCHLPGIRGNGQIKTEERPIAAFANLDAAAPLRLSGKMDRPLFESRRTKICCLTLRTMFRAIHCICAHGSTFGLPTESKSSSQVQRGQVERSGAPSS